MLKPKSVDGLPNEVLQSILYTLEFEDFVAASMTCKRWRNTFYQDDYWKYALETKYGNLYRRLEFEEGTLWVNKFIKTHLTHKNWMSGRFKVKTLPHDIMSPPVQMIFHGSSLYHSNNMFLNVSEVDGDKFKNTLILRPRSLDTIKHFATDGGESLFVDRTGKKVYYYRNLENGELLIETRDTNERIQLDVNKEKFVLGGRTIKLYDMNKLRMPLFEIEEQYHGIVNSLLYRDNLLFTTHRGKKIRVYDMKSGTKMFTVTGHSNIVHSIDFNDQLLASSSNDSTVRIWEPRMNYQCQHILNHDNDSIRTIKMDSWKLVSGSKSGVVKLWDLATGEPIFHFKESYPIKCVDMDDERLFLGSSHVKMMVFSKMSLHDKSCCIS